MKTYKNWPAQGTKNRSLHRAWIYGCVGLLLLAPPAETQAAPKEDNTMATTQKTDLYKEHKADYVKAKTPVLIDIAKAQYLTVTGKGEPGGSAFVEMVGALYQVAYPLKMKNKKAGKDYVVCKLEGLWWGSKDAHNFFHEPRDTWNWKLLIRTPTFITREDVRETMDALLAKGKGDFSKAVKLEPITEGRCVQMLHKGPYSTETETISAMSNFAEDNGLVPSGYHHEIYLSDPNKTEPSKMLTILRQPVKKK